MGRMSLEPSRPQLKSNVERRAVRGLERLQFFRQFFFHTPCMRIQFYAPCFPLWMSFHSLLSRSNGLTSKTRPRSHTITTLGLITTSSDAGGLQSGQRMNIE